MPNDKSPVTQVKLSDGTTVGINEHVYMTPEHLGEPYYIGRVMEFCKASKTKELQVRVCWYSRPKDVFNLTTYDASLLIATMNTDYNPISSIRGKCKVVHKHYIPNNQFESYKAQGDRFYYSQLYDRYMQRLYDLLPCDLVQNVPMDIQEALNQRYQFIIVEQGRVADLTGARRTCCVCQTWCNSTSSVKCAGCYKNFHMNCLTPPLTRKPSKGFAWQCAFCSKNELEDQPASSSPSPDSQPIPSTTTTDHGKRTARLRFQQQQQAQQKLLQEQKRQQEKKEKEKRLLDSSRKTFANNLKIYEDPSQVRTTASWPFRYFSSSTTIDDLLDIDARIYPTATCRIGSKYQATVPDWKDSSNLQPSSVSPVPPKKRVGRPVSKPTSSQSSFMDDEPYKENSSSRNKRTTERQGKTLKRKDTSHSQTKNLDDLPNIRDENVVARGTDSTVKPIFSEPERLKDKQLDDYIGKVQALPNLPLPPHSTDVYDLALLMLQQSNYDTTVALDKIQRMTRDDFAFMVTWKPEEIKMFEQSVQENGHELYLAKQRVQTKSMADIVRFFYQWKKSDRYEPVYSEWTKVYKPTKKFKTNTRSILDCLGKHQQNDQSIIDSFPPQQLKDETITSMQQKRSHNDRRKKMVSATTKDDNSTDDTSDESDSDSDNDDPADKTYRKRWKHQTDTLGTTVGRPSTGAQNRPIRVTRRSTSLGKLTTTTENLTTSGNTNTSTGRKLDENDSSSDDDSSNDEDDKNNKGDKGNKGGTGIMKMIVDPTVIPPDAINNNEDQSIECYNCHATQSTLWRRVPGDTDRKQKVFSRALCDECGTYWLKYCKKRPVKSHDLDTNGVVTAVKVRGRAMKRKHSQFDDDLDGTTLKKSKEDPISIKIRLLSCQVCYSANHSKHLVSCIGCRLTVHYDCFGIDEKFTRNWRCDMCKNNKKQTVSNVYQCTLCGNEPCHGKHAMKVTSGYNWSHVTCALFVPQVKFINPSTMGPVEYVGSITNLDRTATCKLCTRTGVGFYLTCDDEKCNVQFHAHCALEHGYQAGFTIETPSTSYSSCGPSNETLIAAQLFGPESTSGVMIPRIYCPHHDLPSSSHLYPMNTRSQDDKTWIRIYTDLYKLVAPNTTTAMRRYSSWCQRNKLPLPDLYKNTLPSVHYTHTNNDLTLATKSSMSYQPGFTNTSCSQCPITSSPFWWTVDDIKATVGIKNLKFTGKICQRCYCDYKCQAQQSGVLSSISS